MEPMTKFEIINYKVQTDPVDGRGVYQARLSGDTVDLNVDMSTTDIINSLKDMGLLMQDIPSDEFEVDGSFGYSLYIFRKPNHCEADQELIAELKNIGWEIKRGWVSSFSLN